MFKSYLRQGTPNASGGFKATDISTIYKFPPPPKTPVTVSVISFGGGLFGNVSTSGVLTEGDVQALWTSLGITLLNQPKVIVLPIDGATNAPVQDQGDTSENTIDVAMIGACCPTSSLTILLFIAPNSLAEFPNLINSATTPVTIDGIVYTPSVISISWGAAEAYYSADQLSSINTLFNVATQRGFNICAASGDDGSSDGLTGKNVDFPSSSPYVTACGGTNLVCPTLNYKDSTTVEVAWRDGGGGVSSTFEKPVWQTPIAGAIGPKRCSPDIAMVADPSTGVQFIVGGKNVIYGGTSIVSPAMAAYYACLNMKKFLLPTLYTASISRPSPYNDLTVGSNGAYNAGPGFDLVTGFGSLVGDVLTSLINQVPITPIPVTGITLDVSSVNLIVNDTLKITAAIEPMTATNKTISWTSSDTSIATVVGTACPTPTALACGCSSACTCGCATGGTCACSKPMKSKSACGCSSACTCGCAEGGTCACSEPMKSMSAGELLGDTVITLDPSTGHMVMNAKPPTNMAMPTMCDSVGVVKGLAPGKVIITAKSTDGNFTAFATVTVLTIPTIIPVTGVTLDISVLIMDVGQKKQLTATIMPSNATNTSVLWTYTGTAATVSDSGLVTAAKPGSSTIIVRTVDGGFTARTLVTVISPLISIAFQPTVIALYARTTYTPRLVFNPKTATHGPVTFLSNNPRVASVNANGVITTIAAGRAIIQASVDGKVAYLYLFVYDYYMYLATKSMITPIKKASKY